MNYKRREEARLRRAAERRGAAANRKKGGCSIQNPVSRCVVALRGRVAAVVPGPWQGRGVAGSEPRQATGRATEKAADVGPEKHGEQRGATKRATDGHREPRRATGSRREPRRATEKRGEPQRATESLHRPYTWGCTQQRQMHVNTGALARRECSNPCKM